MLVPHIWHQAYAALLFILCILFLQLYFLHQEGLQYLYMSLYSNARLSILTTVVFQQLKVNKNRNVNIKESSHSNTALKAVFSETVYKWSVNVSIIVTVFCMPRWPVKKMISLTTVLMGSKISITSETCKLSFISKLCHRKPSGSTALMH